MGVKKEKVKLLGVMFLALFINLIRNMNTFPMDCPSDELGTVVSAAMLAGNDWSGVIHGSGYYGFGFYSLFFWLFRITDSPYIIYRVIIICTVLCRIVIIPIVYYVMKYYMNVTSQKMLYGVSFVCAFLYSSPVTSISNEHPYELMIWMVVLLLCKTVEYSNSGLKKKEIFYFLSLCISIIYTLFLHTRALVLLLAAFITLAVLVFWKIKIYYKKVVFTAAMILLPAGYLFANKLIHLYQANIWNAIGSELRNGSAGVSTGIDLLDPTTWSVWMHMLIGMFGTKNVITAGLFSACLVVFVIYLYDFCIKKYSFNIYIFVAVSVSILAMGGTVCSFLLSSWFEGMYTTWHDMEEAYSYSYKGLLYVRYWDVYFPPFAVCMLALLSKMEYRKILRYALFTNVILTLLFLVFIMPVLKVQSAGAGFFYGISMHRVGSVVDCSVFYKGIVISLLFNISCLFAVLGKKKLISIYIFCAFFVFLQANRLYFYDFIGHQRMAGRVDASYRQKCILEQRNINLGEVYVYDDTSFSDYNSNINSILQFYFMRYTIREDIPESLGDNDIIITNRRIEQFEQQFPEVPCYELDDNECWYTYLDLDLDVL